MIHQLLADCRLALRRVTKNPGFATVVVVTLALGIGANTAVFSIFEQVILRPLPIEAPQELVLLDVTGPNMEGHSSSDNRHTVHS